MYMHFGKKRKISFSGIEKCQMYYNTFVQKQRRRNGREADLMIAFGHFRKGKLQLRRILGRTHSSIHKNNPR
jgi:hypothetical protein